MGLALFKERRLAQRRKLTGLLPGKLVVASTGAAVPCRPVDVSRNGLGIVVAQEFEPGTEMILHVNGTPVHLQVAWGQPDFGKHDMFRYGLIAVDPSHDLESMFVRFGCLV